MKRMLRNSFLLCAFLFVFLFSCNTEGEISNLQNKLQSSYLSEDSITLKNHCPPGFELTTDNRCVLISPYQMYHSLQNKGVGGLQTALPDFIDGFTPQQIDLGRYLFFDPILSKDHDMSCASCHQPDKGFSDGLGRSAGRGNHTLQRGAPTLWNSGFLRKFFWDARAGSFEKQAKGPLFDPHEMNNTELQLLQDLNSVALYKSLFNVAFPDIKSEKIVLDQVLHALAAFQSSLVSLNSRYDQYVHGYQQALTDREMKGFNVFRSFVARCSECHTTPLFTNQEIAVIGSPEPKGKPLDGGVGDIRNDPALRAGFKVPTLRNIALTAPYMHSGVFGSLHEVVEFYNRGRGHAVPENEDLLIHWHIVDPKLSKDELECLVAFLHTLTDESFKPAVPKRLPSGFNILAN
jgi:cytochrome c peroxidase